MSALHIYLEKANFSCFKRNKERLSRKLKVGPSSLLGMLQQFKNCPCFCLAGTVLDFSSFIGDRNTFYSRSYKQKVLIYKTRMYKKSDLH